MSPTHTLENLQSSEIVCEIRNHIGCITLNRAKAMNALSLGMIRAMRSALDTWAKDDTVYAVVLHSSSERALCAGGDIRYFYETSTRHKAALLEASNLEANNAKTSKFAPELAMYFDEEYALNLLIAQYPKPYIALMSGVVMGGGMGIAATARLRIVTETSKIAMPEVAIGIFPDVGGTHFLSQLRDQLGVYLGVTGETMNAASTIFVGLADVYAPAVALPDLMDLLRTSAFSAAARGEDILQVCREFCNDFAANVAPDESILAQHAGLIQQCFAAETVAEILDRLDVLARARAKDETPDPQNFAAKTAATMRTRSPLMMCLTLAAIRRVQQKDWDLRQALALERRLVENVFIHGEVDEGVRALVIDKDHAPKWNPAQLGEVSPEMVAAMLA